MKVQVNLQVNLDFQANLQVDLQVNLFLHMKVQLRGSQGLGTLMELLGGARPAGHHQSLASILPGVGTVITLHVLLCGSHRRSRDSRRNKSKPRIKSGNEIKSNGKIGSDRDIREERGYHLLARMDQIP